MQELGRESLDSAKILVCASLMDCDNLHDVIQTWQEVFGFYSASKRCPNLTTGIACKAKITLSLSAVLPPHYDSPAGVLEQFSSRTNPFYYANGTTDAGLPGTAPVRFERGTPAKCAQLEQSLLDECVFLPIFYKNQYCITKSNNKDIGYDPFSGALNFRNAKHFE